MIYLSATCVLNVFGAAQTLMLIKCVTIPSHYSLPPTMLILIFVYYLVQGASIDAGPIPSFDNRSSPANHCTDLDHCRTLLSIVWSCFATIFACTWASIHPNVPCPKKREADSWIQKCIWNPLLSFAEHRLPLFICALFVPEYVLAWAIRQFLRARYIAKENKSELKKVRLYFHQWQSF